ncbi:hypothetical protein DFQ04_1448 [Algoriphagus boseongensis]|uniref:Methyltransferase family protein n=1 Tax=Algoriphagus boseongensis TaxID=1442587 RepID=A0A4R6TDW9_9BACT|nr:class I SAM-dependent methyltransferase [Algoriphagus boseongensis]TDQ19624.1 hypothetical protein DFQ04_1448 [Algoriphagus boseongensis]
MDEFKIASKVYKDYSIKEGNQHIASEYNLFHILKYCKDRSLINILEIGTGIGTILSLFQEAKSSNFLNVEKYIGTEKNQYCLDQIKRNCIDNDPSELNFKIVGDGSDIQDNGYDFAVVDGSAEFLDQIISKRLKKNALILVEGYREDQVNKIKSILKELGWSYTYFLRFSTWKNPSYGPFQQKFQAGHTIFFLNPSQNDIDFCSKMKTWSRFRYHSRKFFNYRSLHRFLD